MELGVIQLTVKKNAIYAIYGPEFSGIVLTLNEYQNRVKGKKKTFGKKFLSEETAYQWLETNKATSVIKTNSLLPANPKETSMNKDKRNTKKNTEVVIYIDGSYKNGRGKYGFIGFAPLKTEPLFKTFGYVYDDEFNKLHNIGAELMACLRALEWAYSNNMKTVHIIYDCEGIINIQQKEQTQGARKKYYEAVNAFKKKLDIHFLHVRHGNNSLHQEAHKLSQMAVH